MTNAVLFPLVDGEGFNLFKTDLHAKAFLIGHSLIIIDERQVIVVQSLQVIHHLEGALIGKTTHDETFFALEL